METSLSDFKKRCIYTAGLILIWRMSILIPVPGIHYPFLRNYFSRKTNIFFISAKLLRYSLLELGLKPYLGVYIFIELLSLVLAPLKSWRLEGELGRLKIKKLTYIATFFTCLIQGYFIATLFERIQGLIASPGLKFRLFYSLIVTMGTFFSIFIAKVITDHGIGNGISLLLFTGYLIDLLQFNPDLNKNLMTFLFIAVILVLFIVFFEKSYKKIPIQFDKGVSTDLTLKLTTAGTVPASFASSPIIFCVTGLCFLNKNDNPFFNVIINHFSPGKIGYFIISFITIFIIYYIFTAFFHDTDRIVDFFKERNATIMIPSSEEEKRYIDRSLEFMAFWGALYLFFFVIVPNITNHFFGLYFNGIYLIAVVAICMDLTDEIRIRTKGGRFERIAEFHDLSLVAIFKNLLEHQGIPFCLKGYYHRALLYFFGPFIEVTVYIPEERMKEAKKIVKKYRLI